MLMLFLKVSEMLSVIHDNRNDLVSNNHHWVCKILSKHFYKRIKLVLQIMFEYYSANFSYVGSLKPLEKQKLNEPQILFIISIRSKVYAYWTD